LVIKQLIELLSSHAFAGSPPAISNIYEYNLLSDHVRMGTVTLILSIMALSIVVNFAIYMCSTKYRAAVLNHIDGGRYSRHKDDDYNVKNARDVLNQQEIYELEKALRQL
jgi:hypothetical protein